jgi:hypothetical protein
MKPTQRFGLSVLLVVAIGLPVFAYEYPLSSTSIRDAYILGNRKDEHTAEFFAQYTHHFPIAKTGLYVDEIGLDTPFSQVVERSGSAANYHAQEAEEEFIDKPMIFRVHVQIFGTPVFSPNAAFTYVPDYWKDFKIQFMQDKEIPSKSVHASLLYPPTEIGDGITLPIGVRVEFEYDAAQIDDAPATVRVTTLDGQEIESTFDLDRLR